MAKSYGSNKQWSALIDRDMKKRTCDNNCGGFATRDSIFCKECQKLLMLQNEEILGTKKMMNNRVGEVCGKRRKKNAVTIW